MYGLPEREIAAADRHRRSQRNVCFVRPSHFLNKPGCCSRENHPLSNLRRVLDSPSLIAARTR